jgi:hypothetical protein
MGKLDPNSSLVCLFDDHDDCLNTDCGCQCHNETVVDNIGKVRTRIKPEEDNEEAQ